MRKSLLLAAVIGTFAASNVALAEDAPATHAHPEDKGTAPATASAAEPTSAHTFSYNLGLYSQYIFRGLAQTGEEAALQGGVDYSHSSGFYAGAWASNISWLEDAEAYDNSSLEVDVYGGYAAEIGETGISYDIGLLQYLYPGDKKSGVKAAETTEIYGSLGYSYFTGKVSVVVSDGAFGFDNADGTAYYELNAEYPIGETGYTIIGHVGYQDFSGKDNSDFDYTDYKLGATKSWDNGVNVGGYYTAVDVKSNAAFTDASGQNISKDQFTFFVQKTF